MSKRRAAQRSAGKVAIGQARHEWLTAITLRRVKALIGAVDTYIDLTIASSAGTRVIELWGKRVADEKFARWLLSTVSTHRMALLRPESAADTAILQGYELGGQDTVPTGKRNDLSWILPGRTAELIDSVVARQPPTSETPDPN